MLKHSLYICVAGLALVGGAFAEDGLQLETIDVSGLRPIAVEDITGSVTVLEADELAIRSVPFLADQLRAVPGVGVSRNGSKGGLTQIRLRGAEANHTLVLIDGIEVSDPTTGETNFGLLSGLNIGRVEVLRGEQSGLYGSDAIGGVINIVTAPQSGPDGFIEFGTQKTLNGQAGYGIELDKGSVSAGVAGFRTDGVDTSGKDGERDGTEQWSAVANGTYEFVPGWDVSGLAHYSQSEAQFDSDTDYDGLLDNVDLSSETEQWIFGGSVSGDAFGLNHQFRTSYSAITRDNYSSGTFADTSEGKRTKLAYSPAFKTEATFAESISLAGLVDYEEEEYSTHDTQYGGLTDQDQSFETLGLGGEVNVDWGALVTFASVRFDDNDGRFDNATTGRFGAAYQTGNIGRFRASLGTGVKNPTFTELFGFFPGSFAGNPDLTPEKSTGWEIGWDQSFGNVSLSATYFEAELEDEIYTAYDASFNSTPKNRIGKSDRSGIELGFNWDATSEVSLSGQASLIDSSADDGSDEIRVPTETASLAISYAPTGVPDSRFGLALDYVGDQDDFDFGSFPSRRVTLGSYVLTSASAELPVSDTVSITLRGENIFNEEISDVFGYHGTGASFLFGVKLR